MATRDDVLMRIRTALGRTQPLSESEAAAIRRKLSEHPRGPLPTMSWDRMTRFRDRCLSLSSTVDEVAGVDGVAAAVARFLSANDLPGAGVCWPEFAGLDWGNVGLAFEARTCRENDKIGLTGAYCAIAETGTLMLLSGPDTPAKTSLVPETHIAVVAASRIVRAMEDGWDLLRREHATLPRQVAFVSGPSRTADIEMTLVLGIHGPYRVHVLLLRDDQ